MATILSEMGASTSKGMDMPGAAQSLTNGDSSRRILARVTHQQNRGIEPPLQLNPSPLPTPLPT